ncbi:MAG: RNA polymerase sigma factor [Pseudonocardiaceae bacterium]
MPALTSYPRPGPTLSTSDLLAAAGEGDAWAWDEIVRRYDRLVCAKVRSYRLQDADALDAMQTTWLRLAENCHRVGFPERLAGWLVTTASRECLRILRREKRTAHPVERVADDLVEPSSGPEQRAVDADTARAVGSLVAQLPPGRRTLVRELFRDHPRSYAEVARAAGIPVGSIGPNRGRALQQLRQMLDECGLGPGVW